MKRPPCRHCKRTTVVVRYRGMCSTCYRDHRHEYPSRYRAWTKAEQDRAVELRKSGLTFAAIAAQLRRTAAAVAKRLHDLGAYHPTNPRAVYGRFARLVPKLCAPGVSDGDLAKRLGTSRQAVRNARVRRGIPAGLTEFEARSRAVRRRMANAAVRFSGDLRWVAEGLATYEAGWPVGCTRRMAEYLEALRLAGSLTLAQWRTRTGAGPAIRHAAAKAVRNGWVVRTRDAGRWSYRLAPGASAERERVLIGRAASA